MTIALTNYTYLGTLTGGELAYLAVALCFLLAGAGWLLIAEPTKHVRNTHYKSKAKTTKRKATKRKLKK